MDPGVQWVRQLIAPLYLLSNESYNLCVGCAVSCRQVPTVGISAPLLAPSPAPTTTVTPSPTTTPMAAQPPPTPQPQPIVPPTPAPAFAVTPGPATGGG